MDTYLTVKEVAVMLKLSVQSIRRYTMLKEIPFHKFCRAVRYKKSEVEEWFEKKNNDTAENQKKLILEPQPSSTLLSEDSPLVG